MVGWLRGYKAIVENIQSCLLPFNVEFIKYINVSVCDDTVDYLLNVSVYSYVTIEAYFLLLIIYSYMKVIFIFMCPIQPLCGGLRVMWHLC